MLKVILISIAIAALGFIPLMGMPGVLVFFLAKPYVYLMYGPLAFEAWNESLGSGVWGLFIILAVIWPITIPIAYWVAQKFFGPLPFFSLKHLVPFCLLVLFGSTIISTALVAQNPTLKKLSEPELLYHALKHDRLSIVKKHLQHSSSENYSYGDPLYVALSNDSNKVVNYLLDNGVSVERFSQDHRFEEHGVTPLHIATKKGSIDIMQKLLQMGVNPNIRTTNGKVPLHYIGQLDKENNRVIEILKKHNADFTAVDNEGNTALMAMVTINAPLEHRPQHAQKLIEYGCPKGAKNNKGQTALDIVQEHQPYEFDLIEILK